MKTREIILCAMFVALITVGTFVRIPVGTDYYTLQFLFTLLAGLILGAKLGATAVGAYVIMGLAGIPVFASGGGLGYVMQPTFGYLLSFIVQAYFCGAAIRRCRRVNFKNVLAVNLGGMTIVYLIGVTWFYFASNYFINVPLTVWTAILYCGVFQCLPDVALCAAAAYIAVRCKKAGLWQ